MPIDDPRFRSVRHPDHLTRNDRKIPTMNVHQIPRLDEFLAPKCARAIPVRSQHMRDVLLWASLDSSTGTIDYDTISGTDFHGRLEFVVLDEHRVIDLVDGTVRPGIRRELSAIWQRFGFEALTLTPEQIETERRFENARIIWSAAGARVPLHFQLRMSDMLEEQPMRLGDLLAHLHGDRDPLPAICALACRAEIDIDLDGPLGVDTMVRLR